MLESATRAGEKNKLVPGWLRAAFVIPCLAGAVVCMFYLGGTFDYFANIQIRWFDGYYVVITTLLTVIVYLLVLLVCLLPALLLTRLARTFYENKKKNTPENPPMNERSRYR